AITSTAVKPKAIPSISATFIILRDCSGEAQRVTTSEALKHLHLKLDDVVEIHGRVRADNRAQAGYEVDVIRAGVLNLAATSLPSTASSNFGSVGPEVILEYRPLAMRNDAVGDVFRSQLPHHALLGGTQGPALHRRECRGTEQGRLLGACCSSIGRRAAPPARAPTSPAP